MSTQSRLIINACAEAFNVKAEVIKGESLERRASWPRMASMQLMRENTALSWAQIGNTLGRQPSTAKNAVDRSKHLYHSNPSYANMFARAQRAVMEDIGRNSVDDIKDSIRRAYDNNQIVMKKALALVDAMKATNVQLMAELSGLDQ